MGEAAQKLKKWLAEGEQDSNVVKAVGFAEDVYGKMSGAYGYYQTAKGLLQDFGIIDKPRDPLEIIAEMINVINEKIDDILKGVDEIKVALAANNELIKSWLTETQQSDVRAAFIHAQSYILDPDAELNKLVFIDSINDSWSAVGVLSSESFWLRLFGEDAVYSDIWSGVKYPDGTPAKYVWDYRISLPTFLQVLEWHTIVYLAAIEMDPVYQSHVDSMKKLGETLVNVYQKILSGFDSIPAPSLDEMKHIVTILDNNYFYTLRKQGLGETLTDYDYIDPVDNLPVKIIPSHESTIRTLLNKHIPGGRWRLAGYNFGIVEKYTGYDSTYAFPIDELKIGSSMVTVSDPLTSDYGAYNPFWLFNLEVNVKDPAQFENFYNRFHLKHTLRNRRQRRQIYRELGLPKLYNIIKSYYSLIKLEAPKALDDIHQEFVSVSLRKSFTSLPPAITGITNPNGEISMRTSGKKIRPNPFASEFSLRDSLLLDEILTPLA